MSNQREEIARCFEEMKESCDPMDRVIGRTLETAFESLATRLVTAEEQVGMLRSTIETFIKAIETADVSGDNKARGAQIVAVLRKALAAVPKGRYERLEAFAKSFRCHCPKEYTDRGSHAPDCHRESAQEALEES